MNEVQVVFTYDEATGLWKCKVVGCSDTVEAKQAFSAVVMTCQMVPEELLEKTVVDEEFNITPTIYG